MSINLASINDIVVNDPGSAHNNAITINALLAPKGNPVILPPGDIYIDDTLIVEDVVLSGAGMETTRLIMTASQKPVIEFKNNSRISNFDIILPAGYTDRAIRIQSASMVDSGYIERLNILGKDATYTGTAIGTEGSSGWIQFVRISEITIRFVKYGLFVNHTGAGYFNGCVIHSVQFNNTTTAISLTGANGNIFSELMSEPSPDTAVVYDLMDSSNNVFCGYVWDTPINAKVFRFDHISNNNTILYMISPNYYFLIEDYGKHNRTIPDLTFLTGMKVDKSVLGFDAQGNYNYVPPVMTGEQDDILANAGSRYVITTSGAPIIGGSIKYIFGNTNPNYNVEFGDPTANPIVITIDGKTASAFTGLQLVGLCFSNMEIGSSLKFQLSQDGTTWFAGEEIENDRSIAVVSFGDNNYDGFSCRYIRITINTPYYNQSVNPSRKIRISRIFASSNRMQGDKWLPRRGGNLWGDIELPSNSGVILTSPNGQIRKRLDIDNQGNIRLTTL